MALTRHAILQELRAVVDGARSVEAFNAWLAEHSWNMHQQDVPQDVIDFVGAIENDLAQQPDDAALVARWKARLEAEASTVGVPMFASVSTFTGEAYSIHQTVSALRHASLGPLQALAAS